MAITTTDKKRSENIGAYISTDHSNFDAIKRVVSKEIELSKKQSMLSSVKSVIPKSLRSNKVLRDSNGVHYLTFTGPSPWKSALDNLDGKYFKVDKSQNSNDRLNTAHDALYDLYTEQR